MTFFHHQESLLEIKRKGRGINNIAFKLMESLPSIINDCIYVRLFRHNFPTPHYIVSDSHVLLSLFSNFYNIFLKEQVHKMAIKLNKEKIIFSCIVL